MMLKHRVYALCLAAGLTVAGGAHAARYYDYHGRDFGRFSPRDLGVWRGGRWINDWHDGRYGWWWSVGPYWYFYPQPIYPYPTYVPPAIVVQQAPPMPQGLPPSASWYFCDNPAGYYPYVASCSVQWREVPSSPPPGQAPAAPPSAPPR